MDPERREGPSDGAVVFDDLVDALSDIRRRTLLVALLSHNPQDGESVALGLDGSEADEAVGAIRMAHVHLPKLENYGFIDWNRASDEVSKGPNFEAIRPALELLRSHEDDLPPEWL